MSKGMRWEKVRKDYVMRRYGTTDKNAVDVNAMADALLSKVSDDVSNERMRTWLKGQLNLHGVVPGRVKTVRDANEIITTLFGLLPLEGLSQKAEMQELYKILKRMPLRRRRERAKENIGKISNWYHGDRRDPEPRTEPEKKNIDVRISIDAFLSQGGVMAGRITSDSERTYITHLLYEVGTVLPTDAGDKTLLEWQREQIVAIPKKERARLALVNMKHIPEKLLSQKDKHVMRLKHSQQMP